MTLYDQHLHSRHSVDSRSDPAEVVRQAIDRGLAGVTFTEHYDSHPSEWPVCIYDDGAIAADIARLRARDGSRLFIGRGIEVCYQPAQMGHVLDHLASRSYDLVMISVHWFDGRALHERSHWDGLDVAEATRRYLETVLSAARFARDLARGGNRAFDVLGHLDLVKRYTQRYFDRYDVRAERELVDEILRTCLEADLVPEINVSTLRQSLPEPMPAEWAVRRYAELGGRAMPLGSDAHQVEHVGAFLPEAATMLARQGITHQAVFQDRRREEIPWDPDVA